MGPSPAASGGEYDYPLVTPVVQGEPSETVRQCPGQMEEEQPLLGALDGEAMATPEEWDEGIGEQGVVDSPEHPDRTMLRRSRRSNLGKLSLRLIQL